MTDSNNVIHTGGWICQVSPSGARAVYHCDDGTAFSWDPEVGLAATATQSRVLPPALARWLVSQSEAVRPNPMAWRDNQ
jgi:hypothetical protein